MNKKEFLKSLCAKYVVGLDTVELIIKSQFIVIEQSIRDKSPEGATVMHLGKFLISEKRREDEVNASE